MAITDHIQYSAADIQRYLEGKMPTAEMHALEKAALDDPFLADAIEGMQQTLEQHNASVIHTHLQELSQQVQERITKKEENRRVVTFRWWQVAAAAAIIVVAGIGIFRNTSDKQANEVSTIAKVEEKKEGVDVQAQQSAVADSTAAENALALKDSQKATQEVAANQHNAGSYKEPTAPIIAPAKAATTPWAKAKQEKEAKAEENASAAVAAEEKETLTNHYTVEERKKDSAVVIGYGSRKNQDIAISNTATRPLEQIVIPRSQRDSLAKGYYTKPRSFAELNDETKDMSERQLKRAVAKNPDVLLSGYIKGRVADQFNNPLYNAVVRTTDDDKDFLTDRQGYFKIPIPARDSMVKVAVGFNGYYTQNLRLQNFSDNNITLNQLGIKPPNPALNNSIVKKDTLTFNVVKARGISNQQPVQADKSKSSVQDVLQPNVQPEYGWLEYHQYIDKNKKLPEENPLNGNVVISFLVDKKGRLSDFKIEESLRQDYDDEAIRLVKAGPSWKLVKGSKASRATVIVHF